MGCAIPIAPRAAHKIRGVGGNHVNTAPGYGHRNLEHLAQLAQQLRRSCSAHTASSQDQRFFRPGKPLGHCGQIHFFHRLIRHRAPLHLIRDLLILYIYRHINPHRPLTAFHGFIPSPLHHPADIGGFQHTGKVFHHGGYDGLQVQALSAMLADAGVHLVPNQPRIGLPSQHKHGGGVYKRPCHAGDGVGGPGPDGGQANTGNAPGAAIAVRRHGRRLLMVAANCLQHLIALKRVGEPHGGAAGHHVDGVAAPFLQKIEDVFGDCHSIAPFIDSCSCTV